MNADLFVLEDVSIAHIEAPGRKGFGRLLRHQPQYVGLAMPPRDRTRAGHPDE